MEQVIDFVFFILYWMEDNTGIAFIILGVTFLIGVIRESELLLGVTISLAFVLAFIGAYGV